MGSFIDGIAHLAWEGRRDIVASPDEATVHFVFSALTSMTGVSRVVAVVAGDPQNPVLDVVHHPVGRHRGAAVHRDGRCRLLRQVRVYQGLQPDAWLVSTLQNTLGAYHCRSERTEIRGERGWALTGMRGTLRAAPTTRDKRSTSRSTRAFLQWGSRTQSKVITLRETGRHQTLGGVALLAHALNSIRTRNNVCVEQEPTIITAFI